MCGKRCFSLLIGSHGCQRHGWTLSPNVSTNTPQNHGSWISRELGRREPEMRNPMKSHADWSWKNLENVIKVIETCHIHWTAAVIVIASENLFSKRAWHPLRPPASFVLDVQWGLSCQQQLRALHAAEVCCKMQRSLTSARRRRRHHPAAPSVLWAPGPSEFLMSMAAPFPRRNMMIAGWSHCAAQCSGAPPPAILSRQRRSRRRWPRTAARSPLNAASAMWSSRRAEKWSRNEVPQLLWSLCFIFSKYKSATYEKLNLLNF